MRKDQIIIALDIGTTKICTLLAELDRQGGDMTVVGVGTAPSMGVRKGVVVDIDEVARAIAESVRKCERLSGYVIESAYVGVTGSHISGMNRQGIVAISPNSPEINEADVSRAMEAARVQAIANDREILHVLPRGYNLDGQDGIRDPLGMTGHRLEAEIHVVTASTTCVHNLVRCVNRAGLQVDDLILQPLAASESALSRPEKEQGVALVDIGGGTTDVAIFSDGGNVYTSAIGIGGNHITSDLALGLRAPFAVAEQVKKLHGAALTSAVDPDAAIEIETFDRDEGELVSAHLVAEIIESRAQEIFSLVRAEIQRSGFEGALPAGAVLVGGTSELRGIRNLGKEVLDLPVRAGCPSGVTGLTDTILRPAYATTIGLLLWAAYHTESMQPSGASMLPSRGVNRLKGWLRGYRA